MTTVNHNTLTNDPLNGSLHNLHFPGYITANSTSKTAITTMQNGDLCYQEDIGQYFFFNGDWATLNQSVFDPTGTVFSSISFQGALEELSDWLVGTAPFPTDFSLTTATGDITLTTYSAPGKNILLSSQNGQVRLQNQLASMQVGDTGVLSFSVAAGGISVQPSGDTLFNLPTGKFEVAATNLVIDNVVTPGTTRVVFPSNHLLLQTGLGKDISIVSANFNVDSSSPGLTTMTFINSDAVLIQTTGDTMIDATTFKLELNGSNFVVDSTTVPGTTNVNFPNSQVAKLNGDNGMIFDLSAATGNTVMQFISIPGSGLFKFMDSPIKLFDGVSNKVIGIEADNFPGATEARIVGGLGMLLNIMSDNGILLDLSAATGSTVLELKTSGGVIDLTSISGAIRAKTDVAFVVQDSAGVLTYLVIDGNTSPGTTLIDAGNRSMTIGNSVNGGEIDFLTSGQSIVFNPGNGNVVVSVSAGGAFYMNVPELNMTSSIVENLLAVADLPTGGNIGTAGTTVDIRSSFKINQTTAGQTITLPNPSNGVGGRRVTVLNVGSQSFTFYGQTVATSTGIQVMWSSSAWLPIIS